MSIKISGNQGFGSMRPMDGAQGAKDDRKTNAGKSSDKVAFSTVMQNVNQARQMSSPADVERTEKVQALKQQVAEGNYRPDMNKVASSLLRFIAEGK